MTKSQKIAYGLLTQTVLLLMLYAAAALLGAAKFLTPDDPLALSLPYNQLGGLANLLLHFAALTGLLGGGVYVAAGAGRDEAAKYETALQYASWLWTALLILGLLAGVIGLLEGRGGLELPRVLDVYESIMLVGFIMIVSVNAPRSPLVRVWGIGLLIAVIGLLAGVVQPSDYVQDRVLRTLAVGLQINVGFPLAAAALGYWLIRRFSSVPRLWTDIGIYTVGGLIAVAGALVTLAPLFRLGGGGGAYWLGNIALFAVPILYLIFAAHSYGALSERTHTHSLAAHWYALSLLLLLIGVGFLGGLQSQADVGQWTAGTRLTDLQSTLSLLGVAAMGLGMVDHTASDLYARQKRINGLTPFWLVAFGIIIGAAALGGAGIAQVYMERILSVGYLDVQTLVTPLYMLWVLGLLLLAAGIGVYAFTFWLRRPSSDS